MSSTVKNHIEAASREHLRGVYFFPLSEAHLLQEAGYRKVRKKEGRLASDEMLRSLPSTEPGHPHASEWQIRGASLEKLISYLSWQRRPLTILDIGCGNCWMSNRMASLPGIEVIALDTNRFELEQGERVFGRNRSLTFLCGDLFGNILPPDSMDFAVLAGSLQYFPDVQALLERLSSLLCRGGEVHILDSPLYSEREIAGAQERTERYYAELGMPEMASYYHHHTLSDLHFFGVTCLYDPKRLRSRFLRRILKRPLSPFPWMKFEVP